MNIKEILKFLFPEYQIFSAWKNLPQEVPEQRQTRVHTSFSQKKVSDKKTEVQTPGFATIYTRQYSDAGGKTESTTWGAAFESFKQDLKKIWIGSDNDINAFYNAFKRPYLSGSNTPKPKNAILLLSQEGRGKHFALSCISKLLYQKKLFTSSEIEVIDFGQYSGDSSGNLFLSDIYSSLASNSNIVIFDSPEKAGTRELNIIQQLLESGVCKLDKRYISENGVLREITGILLPNLISEISANNKFFVFLSNQPQGKVLSALGNKISVHFGDIIVLDPFSKGQLENIAFAECQQLSEKSHQNLHIDVTFDDALVGALSQIILDNSGIKGLKNFVENVLYKTLTEMTLQQAIVANTRINLTCCNGEYIVTNSSGVKMNLADYTQDSNKKELDTIKKELDNIIGLKKVKDFIFDLETNVKIQKMRVASGLPKADISMHMIFTGNPGTGKTTIARIVAQFLKSIGVLSSGHLKEVTRADLVGQYLGETAQKTNSVINSALGGVLFIDEAYSLCRDAGDPFGLEAIDALVKGMEDHRDDLVVILAGYEKEMQEFLKTNSGLKSRFPNIVNFEDYSSQEMVKIAYITARSKGYKIDSACDKHLIKVFERSQIKGENDGGNGRLVRNTIEAAILQQSKRVLRGSSSLDLLIPEDFGCTLPQNFNLEEELSKVIGLDAVKKYIRSLQARLKLKEARKNAGLNTNDTQTMHMIFAGNPGTGKTMMARTVANVLYNMNVISTNKLVETDRSGLVAGYVGQTAIKTREVIESALNGVLFIDEAYALAQGGPNDFGQEAIDTLVKMMDDHRDKLVVILAGYSDDMANFLNQNAGLHSRFANIIQFADYTTDELMLIADKFYKDQGYILDKNASSKLREILDRAKTKPHFGNGRFVRNIFEKTLNNQALRLSSESNYTKEVLITITAADLNGL